MNPNFRMRIAECGIQFLNIPHSTFRLPQFLGPLQYFYDPGVTVNLHGIPRLEDRSSYSCSSHRWDSILPAYNSGMAGQTADVRDGGFDFGEDRSPGRVCRWANKDITLFYLGNILKKFNDPHLSFDRPQQMKQILSVRSPLLEQQPFLLANLELSLL